MRLWWGGLGSRCRLEAGRVRLAGVCAWRWTTDDEESSIGEHDPAIATPLTRGAVGALWRGL